MTNRTVDPDGIFKKFGEQRARLEQLGITKNEMVKFYGSCGGDGECWDQAFATLRERFKFDAEDAMFVERFLGDCGPF